MSIAFVDIDTQVDFIEPSGALYAQGAEALKPRLAALTAFALAHGIPIISSVDAHGPEDAEFANFPPHCLLGSPGQEKLLETQSGEEIVLANPSRRLPAPGHPHIVIEKQEFPIFTNPIAEKVFAASGAERFYVYGVVTEVCVLAAVLGLRERGYPVSVVSDAVWPLSEEGGRSAEAKMRSRGVSFISTGDLLTRVGEETAQGSSAARAS